MEHHHDTSPISRILTREAERRRASRQAEQLAEARATEQLRKLSQAWAETRTTLLAEISAANMLIKLHKLEDTFTVNDHAVRDADNLAQLDIRIGRSLARVAVCAYSGDIGLEHVADGMATFRCKRFKLNCLTVTREDLQDVLGVLLACALRHVDEQD